MATMLSHRSPPAVALAALLLAVPGSSVDVSQDPPSATVVSARMRAAVEPASGRADVHVVYRMSGRPSTPIRIEALDFGPAVVRAVGAEGSATAIPLGPESGHLRAGELPAVPSGDSVVVTYTVEGAVEADGGDVRLRLPVVVVDLPPHTADGPVFHARIEVPDDWRVTGAFPTGLARTDAGSWEVDLAVVPSLVSLRARTDGAWRPGLPVVLDVLAVVVLLGFGVVGARHLRSVVRRAGVRE